MRVRALLAAGVCGALLLTAPARALEEEDIRVIAGHPSSSPTADEIVFETDFDHLDHMNLWIASMDGKSSRKLVIDCRNPADPAWSPNGRAIAFTCNDEVMSVSPDGSHLTRLGHGIDATWSPDSAQLAFADSGEIGIMNSDGTDRRLVTSTLRLAKPQDSRAQPFFSDHPSFSPGGDKNCFLIERSGHFRLVDDRQP